MLVRADLSPGMQLAQACHAVSQLCLDHPVPAKRWHDSSNNLVVLQVQDEVHLLLWLGHALRCGFKHAAFREPDLDDELTALALAPDSRLRYGLSNLPLAGRVMASSG